MGVHHAHWTILYVKMFQFHNAKKINTTKSKRQHTIIKCYWILVQIPIYIMISFDKIQRDDSQLKSNTQKIFFFFFFDTIQFFFFCFDFVQIYFTKVLVKRWYTSKQLANKVLSNVHSEITLVRKSVIYSNVLKQKQVNYIDSENSRFT